MINLVIGESEVIREKTIKMIENKTVFTIYDGKGLLLFGKKRIESRDLLLIKNLDNNCLFEEIVENLELLKKHKVETIAITYRDDIIEAYEEDEEVNIIDLRGE